MRYLTILLLPILTACSFLPQQTLSNRIACTVARDQAFTVSQYGPLGLTSKIDPADGSIVCK